VGLRVFGHGSPLVHGYHQAVAEDEVGDEGNAVGGDEGR